MLIRIYLVFCFTTILFISGNWKALASDWDMLKPVAKDEKMLRLNTLVKSEQLLLASRYDELDDIADRYRKSKEMFFDGEWKLSVFYEGMSYYLREAPEEDWKRRLDRLEEWVRKKPQSITARIALAECLVGYAFHRRTSKWGSEITEDQWREFDENIKKAADLLIKARELKQKCPGWWAAFQRVAMGGTDRSEYEQLFNEAISFEPSYNTYYYRKAWHLMPRWYGKDGEWEEFAKSAADKVGGKDGDVLYARIVLFMDQRSPYSNSLERNPLISWDRVRLGVKAITDKWGAIVSSRIDLIVNSMAGVLNTTAGTDVSITTSVKNIGVATAVTSSVKFYLSTDKYITTADIYLGKRSTGGDLLGGSSSRATTVLTIPVATASGIYYLGVIADANNENSESDETNNTMSTQIAVQ